MNHGSRNRRKSNTNTFKILGGLQSCVTGFYIAELFGKIAAFPLFGIRLVRHRNTSDESLKLRSQTKMTQKFCEYQKYKNSAKKHLKISPTRKFTKTENDKHSSEDLETFSLNRAKKTEVWKLGSLIKFPWRASLKNEKETKNNLPHIIICRRNHAINHLSLRLDPLRNIKKFLDASLDSVRLRRSPGRFPREKQMAGLTSNKNRGKPFNQSPSRTKIRRIKTHTYKNHVKHCSSRLHLTRF